MRIYTNNVVKTTKTTATTTTTTTNKFSKNSIAKNNDKYSNNEDHLLVNLPFILLNKIIKEFDEDIDIICFSLVCKRWFDNRNSYLSFNYERFSLVHTRILNESNNRHFTLNSYRGIIKRSLNKKQSNCTLLVIKNPFKEVALNTYKSIEFDEVLSVDEFKSYQDIPIQFSTIKFEWFEFDTEMMMKLSKSNVHTIYFSGSYKNGENRLIIKERFPSNIKTIISNGSADLNMHILPLELETLNDISLQLKESPLPQSLKSLRLNSTTDSYFNIDSLPPNLEEFYFYSDRTDDENKQLPPTLKIACFNTSWLKNIKYSQSIHTLCLHLHQLKVGDIPESVTHLTISSGFYIMITKEMLPPNIIYLSIKERPILQDNIFSSFEHLETLNLSGLDMNRVKPFGVLPKSLRNLYLPKFFNERLDHFMVLPPSLEFLDFGYSFNKDIKVLAQTSIKTIAISREMKLNRWSLPKSVEHIDFKEFTAMISPEYIAPTIRSISLSGYYSDNLVFVIPQTLTSINITKLSGWENIEFRARRLSEQSFLLFGTNHLISQKDITMFYSKEIIIIMKIIYYFDFDDTLSYGNIYIIAPRFTTIIFKEWFDIDAEMQLPLTLKTEFISSAWMNNIRYLQSLHTLTINIAYHSKAIKVGDIPENIPPNIRYLDLVSNAFIRENLFSEFEHLETLHLSYLQSSANDVVGVFSNSLRNLYPLRFLEKRLESYTVLPLSLELLANIFTTITLNDSTNILKINIL
ncbi:hypothetical protein PPL_06891 [Heterostelium album PN500]|uniref:Uncharacterized protein n=1 Tax=Heterostelium pallidum (strain ATCC 26659 / Pp 5 / PN500) TaxID=670386 RepID=D3BDT8_HETP5|nr:hypothetical protein PPL_06891 [Heterostelium album PN500]EFA80069.1 hypothetical protein PPL_06891 [Heterostelium album PN500]|eukprot:XP_020432189.1 hypothetical protein PPL_06891 [Heterostelium album PN500]